MQWRDREKRNDQEHHVKFFHLADKKCLLHFLLLLMLFVFEGMSSSLPVACYVITHVAKRSNGRSQIFFKTGVL